MLSQAQSHTAADVPDLPWEAQLAEAILVLYKAEQAVCSLRTLLSQSCQQRQAK